MVYLHGQILCKESDFLAIHMWEREDILGERVCLQPCCATLLLVEKSSMLLEKLHTFVSGYTTEKNLPHLHMDVLYCIKSGTAVWNSKREMLLLWKLLFVFLLMVLIEISVWFHLSRSSIFQLISLYGNRCFTRRLTIILQYIILHCSLALVLVFMLIGII